MRIALLALLLAGCLGRQAPEPTLVPVREPCIDARDVPPEVPPVGELPADARQTSSLLGATILALRANERVLRGLIHGCVR